MFAKLLKHEFKSCAGLMGALTLGCLAVGVGAGLLLRYMVHSAEQMIANDSLEVVLGLLFAFSFLALFAFTAIGSIYPYIQFYKRKFTDQGYLTFTLPVRGWQIYLTSFLNVLIWDVLLVLCMFAGILLVFGIGFVGTEIWGEMVRSFPASEMEQAFGDLNFFNPATTLVSMLSSVMIMMNSVVLGAVIAKKHKVLGALGAYYATTMLMSAVSASLMNLEYIPDPALMIQRMNLISTLIGGGIALGGAALSIWLMDKKLNLP